MKEEVCRRRWREETSRKEVALISVNEELMKEIVIMKAEISERRVNEKRLRKEIQVWTNTLR